MAESPGGQGGKSPWAGSLWSVVVRGSGTGQVVGRWGHFWKEDTAGLGGDVMWQGVKRSLNPVTKILRKGSAHFVGKVMLWS